MKKLNLSRAVIQACLIFWAALQIFPLYWLLTFSLKDNTEIFQGNMVGLPSVWRFENYTHAFMGGNVGRYLANSIIVTAATILIVCIASLMASYALIRMKWKLQKTFQLIFIMGITIPIHAALLPVFIMMRQVHLINTYWCLIIPYSAFAVPMAIMISSGFISPIPVELEEAAAIDGCSRMGIVWRIVFPLLKPVTMTVVVLSALGIWNDYQIALVVVSKEAVRTLPVAQQSFIGQQISYLNLASAACLLSILPMFFLFLFLQKFIVQGVTAGAVKG